MGVDNECLLCSRTYSYENKMAGFVEYQCSVGEGVQVYVRKVCYIGCKCLPRRKIGTHCVDVGSGWSRD